MKHPMQCAKCFRVCRLSDSGKTWVCTICKHREKANGGQAVSDKLPHVEVHEAMCKSIGDMANENEALKGRIKRLEDCAETAWGIIANVDSGSWQEQRADWREAATRWRDEQFHPELSERKAKEAKP